MFVKDCFYIGLSIIMVLSTVFLILSIVSKNKTALKWIMVDSIVYMVYIVAIIFITPKFYFPIGFEILIFIIWGILSELVYLISMIISIVKICSSKYIDNRKNNIYMTLSIILFVLPIFIVLTAVGYNMYTINSSDLIVVYEAHNGNTIGSAQERGIAVKGNKCTMFDIGVSTGGYHLNNFLFKNMKEINDLQKIGYNVYFGYNSVKNNTDAAVYKNDERICAVSYTGHDYDIDISTGYYIEK